MNQEKETFERELGQTLQRRADVLHETPFTLSDVRGRARSIRRRRRSAVAGAVLAVAAVVTPVAVLTSGGDGDRTIEPAAPETVPYVVDGELVRGDAPPVPLEEAWGNVRSFTELTDGRVIVSGGYRHPKYVVTVLSPDGTVEGMYDASYGLAGTADGSVAAWVDPDGVPYVLESGGAPVALAPVDGRDYAPVAVQCDEGCEVTVVTYRADGSRPSWVVDTQREVRPATEDGMTMVDVSPDGSRLASLSHVADDDIHMCGGVYDRSESLVWESCEYNVYEFSPDGAHLLATFAEGLGPRYVALVDAASGEEVTRLTGYDVVADQAWEDDVHALAVAHRDGEWHLLRVGLDGEVETVAGPFPGDEMSPPVVLPER